jgi:hypothetical protein
MKPLPAICRVIVLARRFFWRPALLRRSTRPAQFTTTSAHQRAKTTSFSQRLKGATVFQICAALGYFASQHWLRKQRVKLSAKNEIAKAITYSLNQWRGHRPFPRRWQVVHVEQRGGARTALRRRARLDRAIEASRLAREAQRVIEARPIGPD